HPLVEESANAPRHDRVRLAASRLSGAMDGGAISPQQKPDSRAACQARRRRGLHYGAVVETHVEQSIAALASGAGKQIALADERRNVNGFRELEDFLRRPDLIDLPGAEHRDSIR